MSCKKFSREKPFNDGFFASAVHNLLNSKPLQNILQRRGFRRLWRKNQPFVWKFQQILFRYFLNCRSSNVWHGTRMARFRDFSCAEEMRHSGYRIVPNAGWHFTWLGGVETIRKKLAATAHQEFNLPQFTDPQYIERTINTPKVLFGHHEELKFVPIDDSFPRYLRENQKLFLNLIMPLGNVSS